MDCKEESMSGSFPAGPPPLVDLFDYNCMKMMKNISQPKHHSILIHNLPMYYCQGDVYDLCRELSPEIQIKNIIFSQNGLDASFPPLAVVEVLKKDAETLIKALHFSWVELPNVGRKRIFAEDITGKYSFDHNH